MRAQYFKTSLFKSFFLYDFALVLLWAFKLLFTAFIISAGWLYVLSIVKLVKALPS